MNLFFFPDYTSTNPYQTLLYSGFIKEDTKAQFGSIESALACLIEHPTQEVVFHLHWQNTITGIVDSAHEHRIFAKAFLSNLKAFQSLGGIVAWTIHNRLPHDVKFKQAELAFHQALANAVDIVFLHNKSALDQVLANYHVDAAKVAYIEHGHYINSYPNEVSQSQARSALNLPSNHFVYGFIGQLRPYKGLNEFIDATYDFTGDTATTALIAGKPVWPYHKGQVTQLCSALNNIKVVESFITDNDLQCYINACDVIVLPYKEILTSGSMILAASFSKAVLVPELASFSDVLSLPFVFSYDPNSANGLSSAIKHIKSLSPQERLSLGAQAKEYASTLDWARAGQVMLERFSAAFSNREINYKIQYNNQVLQQQTLIANSSIIPAKGEMAICVVNYHNAELIRTLAQSIAAHGKSSVRVFVLDNSQDEAEYAKLRGIEGLDCVLKSNTNLGYAAGNNCLIKLAKDHNYQKIAILNPDIVITEDVFSEMSVNIDNDPQAVYSPLILRDENTISFYRARINTQSSYLHIKHELDGLNKDFAPAELVETDLVNGCAMFFDAKLVDEFGYIPENYFLYFEESDWAMSIREQGGKLFTDASSTLIHKKQTQHNGLPSLTYSYYLLRNALTFAAKHGFDVAETKSHYQQSFVSPWAKRIKQAKPNFAHCFDAVCKLAFADGEKGVSGAKDFLLHLHEYASSSIQSKGYVEVLNEHRIIGWAANYTNENAKADSGIATLLLINNGSIEQGFPCSVNRPDLSAMGYNKIAGFDYKTDKSLNVKQLVVLDAKSLKAIEQMDAAQTSEAQNQSYIPNIIRPHYNPNLVRGHIDFFESGRITGWAHDELHPDISLEVELVINDEVCAYAIANRFRDGLKKRKKNNGYCAFVFYVPPSVLHQYEADESVNVAIRARGREEIIATKELNIAVVDETFNKAISLIDFYKWSFYKGASPYGMYEQCSGLQQQISNSEKSLVISAQEQLQKNSAPSFISIIMPVFNREKEVMQAIASVLKQSYSHFELIIVDDGSTDNTASIVQDSIDSHSQPEQIKLIHLANNSGVSYARNRGLEQAKGDIIAYLDSDNEWASNYLSILNYMYEQHPEHNTAYAGQEVFFVDPMNTIKFRTCIRMQPFNRSKLEAENFIDLNVFSHRAQTLKRYGGFREDMRRLVDWEFILKYTKHQAPIFIPALMNRYHFGLANNQITATESYAKNLKAMFREPR